MDKSVMKDKIKKVVIGGKKLDLKTPVKKKEVKTPFSIFKRPYFKRRPKGYSLSTRLPSGKFPKRKV